MSQGKIIKQILKRLDLLEKAVFNKDLKSASLLKQKKEFRGAKGGIVLLLKQKFFTKRRTAPEVKTELRKNNYDYRIQVVQTALNRLSKIKGPLTACHEKGKKVYVKRK